MRTGLLLVSEWRIVGANPLMIDDFHLSLSLVFPSLCTWETHNGKLIASITFSVPSIAFPAMYLYLVFRDISAIAWSTWMGRRREKISSLSLLWDTILKRFWSLRICSQEIVIEEVLQEHSCHSPVFQSLASQWIVQEEKTANSDPKDHPFIQWSLHVRFRLTVRVSLDGLSFHTVLHVLLRRLLLLWSSGKAVKSGKWKVRERRDWVISRSRKRYTTGYETVKMGSRDQRLKRIRKEKSKIRGFYSFIFRPLLLPNLLLSIVCRRSTRTWDQAGRYLMRDLISRLI